MPAVLAPEVVRALVEAVDRIDPVRPYVPTVEPVLRLLVGPVALLGTFTLFLAPGLFGSIALGGVDSLERWIVRGFAVSVVVVPTAAAAVQYAIGAPLEARSFGLLVSILALAGYGILELRRVGGAELVLPSSKGAWGRDVAWIAVVPLLLTAVLAPKIHWEAFNGDGAHILEVTRALLYGPLPFFPETAGKISSYPSANSMLVPYALSPWVRWLGPVETAVRAPFLPFLGVLYAAVIAVARRDRDDVEPTSAAFRILLWASLLCFALAMAFSATYDPYLADLALPATQSALWMILLLGTVDAYFRDERGWLAGFAILTLLTSPGGALSLGAFLVSIAVLTDRRPRGRLVRLGAVVAVGIALLAVLPLVLEWVGVPGPGSEHRIGNLVERLSYVTPWRPRRFLYVLLPMGVFPVVALFAWRSLDLVARSLLATAGILFAIFFLRAFGALHHYVPAMILPVAAFFRWARPGGRTWPGWATAACGFAALVALYAVLPQEGGIHVASRHVGSRLRIEVPGYGTSEGSYFAAIGALNAIFPSDGDANVPRPYYGGSTLAWSYYSQRRDGGMSADYLLGYDENGDLVVRARDPEVVARDRYARPRGSRGSKWLAVPREFLFLNPNDLPPGVLRLNDRGVLKSLRQRVSARPINSSGGSSMTRERLASRARDRVPDRLRPRNSSVTSDLDAPAPADVLESLHAIEGVRTVRFP